MIQTARNRDHRRRKSSRTKNLLQRLDIHVTVNANTTAAAKVDLEVKHLRSAVAAADCGSLIQAAELLRSQQSSLSRRIGELEHHLGITLLERFSGGVRPTQGGRSVLRLARTILEQFDALIATATAIRNSEARRLSVGFCTSLFCWQLADVVAGF
ncbi:DNA-binding transcriptional LysR family regulator [Bradyrhizobium sp. i1.3.1]